MKAITVTLLAAVSLIAQTTHIYKVGAAEQYKTLSALPKTFQPGDVIEISAGTYYEAKQWRAASISSIPVVIRGVTPLSAPPVIDGSQMELASPRALFQFDSGYWRVENIAFQYASNYELNASGIRVVEGSVVISRVKITNSDMGVMSSRPSTLVRIEDSEIAYNGKSEGSHNLYLAGQQALIRRNHIHHSYRGQNIKIRSRLAELKDNYIHDGADGEVEFVDDTITKEPGADAVVEGNTIISTASRQNNNCCRFINFGRGVNPDGDRSGTLYLRRNTFIARHTPIIFVTLASTNAYLVSEGNTYIGSINMIRDRYGAKGATWNDDIKIPYPTTITPKGTAPKAPLGLTAVIGATTAKLTWTAVVGVDHYRVYLSRMGSDMRSGKYYFMGYTTTPEFIDGASFVVGRTYGYQVSAVSLEGVEGPKTPEVKVTK